MMPRVLLVDNGSRRAEAVFSLRRMATQLSALLGMEVDAVPLQHADRIPAHDLDGEAAETLPGYLQRQLELGEKDFFLVPVFFGMSRALTSFVPDTFAQLEPSFGKIQWRIAPPMFDEHDASHPLADILKSNIAAVDAGMQNPVILVDHGSPLPSVTKVRNTLAESLKTSLSAPVHEAVMERREGSEYDFNGPLLENLLVDLAKESAPLHLTLAMLFISPGRHAGAGGDIADICAEAEARHPGLKINITPLVGENPAIADLLATRYHQGIESPAASSG